MIKHILKKILTSIRMARAGKMSISERGKYKKLSRFEWGRANGLWQVKMDNANLKIYDKGYRIYKTLEKFDERYCPNSIFETYIVRALNLPVHVMGLEHKALYDIIFKGLKQPETIVKRINGIYFDSERKIISPQDAYALVSGHESLCVKPTSFSAGGNGVRKLDSANLAFPQFEDLAKQYGENFIIQKIVRQSAKMSELSPYSINTFRVSTLFLNGRCNVCTIIGRIGRANSFVDNGAQGNYMVGVDLGGKFRDIAYDINYNTYDSTDSGIKFGDIKIDEIRDLVKKVEQYHPRYLPNCGFCGWDFALDENNEWVLIEVNLYAPGIEFEQICPGEPLFGNRTKEVIDYVNAHQPSLLAITTSLGFA